MSDPGIFAETLVHVRAELLGEIGRLRRRLDQAEARIKKLEQLLQPAPTSRD